MPLSPLAIYQELELYHFEFRKEMEQWLAKNFERQEGIWILFAKKASPQVSLSYEEARECAIAYGWIDGLKHTHDDDFFKLRFTARRPRSKWSKINRKIAEDLIKAGEMKPAGLREVEAAKANGRWEAAYGPQSEMKVPEYFLREIRKNKRAWEFSRP